MGSRVKILRKLQSVIYSGESTKCQLGLRQPNIERMLQLGLNGMAEAMDDLQKLADSGELCFDNRLTMLLECELAHRSQRSYRAHLRRAQLRI